MLRIIILSIFLTGCIPDVPEVPTAAECSLDGFVLRPVINDITNLQSMQFVLDEEGRAMTCVLK